MKRKYISAYLAAFLLFGVISPIAVMVQSSVVGGYASTSVTNQEVVAAASFAIQAQQAVMQSKNSVKSVKLELVTISAAEQQVVAGMNYRLHLRVKVEGQEKMADAVIWCQVWRKPTPYELTSWDWK